MNEAEYHMKNYGDRGGCYPSRLWATTIKGQNQVKTLLIQRSALRRFHVTDSQNTRDQITRW